MSCGRRITSCTSRIICAAWPRSTTASVLCSTYLDQSGLADNTIVVYTSDQGFYLGEHGWFDKRFMYEQSLRTPLVVRWPGVIEPGSVEDRIVSNVDFAANVFGSGRRHGARRHAGPQPAADSARRESRATGGSRSTTTITKASTRMHHVHKHEGVTNGQAKLIHYYPIGEWEMFDLENDPDEMVNIYGRPEHAELQRELQAELARLRTELEVPPLPEGNARD